MYIVFDSFLVELIDGVKFVVVIYGRWEVYYEYYVLWFDECICVDCDWYIGVIDGLFKGYL